MEKKAGKLRVKNTLYLIFGNSEFDKAEQRIQVLEKEAEQVRYLSEKGKNDIREEVVVLQDRLRNKDKELEQQRKELKAYEEERNWIQRYLSSAFPLLNIRRILVFIGFSDERIAHMAKTSETVLSKAKVYSSLYRRYFEEEDSTLCIKKDAKQRYTLHINGLSLPDWCKNK